MKKITPYFLATLLFTTACTTTNHSYAIFDDVSSTGTSSGYRLIKIDGKDVQRDSSQIATVIPYAHLEPGNHELTFKRDFNDICSYDRPEELTLGAEIEAGKKYMLFRIGDSVYSQSENTEPTYAILHYKEK